VRRSNILPILTTLAISSLLSGCSILPPRPVYVGPGQIVEIARPEKFLGWVTNAETGKRELRTVDAMPGWFVGRPKGTSNAERD